MATAKLGVDVGKVRIGVALAAAGTTFAVPLETIPRDWKGRCIRRIADLAKTHGVQDIIVGYPAHLSGAAGGSVEDAKKFAVSVKRRLPRVRVGLVDERLSSTQAHGRLSAAGVSTRKQRQIVDQVAAQIILDQAIEMERMSGVPAGTEVVLQEQERKSSESDVQ